MNNRKAITGGTIAVFAACVWVFWAKAFVVGDGRSITFRQDGYRPTRLTVRVGDSVTFRNNSGKPFWPASNNHPIHELYPEFDPRKPIAPGESWQFTFTQEGKWRFHDHIYPEFRGTIMVLPPGKTTLPPLDCSASADAQTKGRCWEETLSDALETRGIAGAFKEFSRLYKTDTDFIRSGCHVHAHRIGDEFFQAYASKLRKLEGIELPVETMSCGYGFFHGLFEHFFRKYPDVELARAICDDLDSRYSKTIPLIRINCFHGAGHGLIADPPDPSSWGNPKSLVAGPLALCAQISHIPDESHACIDGIFNVVSSWMGDAKYGMSIDAADPFWLCESVPDVAKESCYYEQIMVMSEMENRDLLAITRKYVAPIADPQIARLVMFSLAASFMQKDVALADHAHMLVNCRNVPAGLKERCLEGVLNGFKGHGEPGNEYNKALAFCALPQMTREEQQVCYPYLVRILWELYPAQKVLSLCSMIPSEYRNACETRMIQQN